MSIIPLASKRCTRRPIRATTRFFQHSSGGRAAPSLVNTSFNVRGEPIVCTPEDAFRCFMGTEMETLVIGNCFLNKQHQDPALAREYKHKFDLD